MKIWTIFVYLFRFFSLGEKEFVHLYYTYIWKFINVLFYLYILMFVDLKMINPNTSFLSHWICQLYVYYLYINIHIIIMVYHLLYPHTLTSHNGIFQTQRVKRRAMRSEYGSQFIFNNFNTVKNVWNRRNWCAKRSTS